MRKIYIYLLAFISLFSCAEQASDTIYQGKLEELIVGGFSLKKDSLTNDFFDLKVLYTEREEFLVYTTFSKDSRKVNYFNLESLQVENQILIPKEGPDAMKQGGYFLPISIKEVVAINPVGLIAKYNQFGKKTSENQGDLELPNQPDNIIRLEIGKGLLFYDEPILQIGLNPSHWVNMSKNTGPGQIRTSFPLDFQNWLIRINSETGETEFSDFSIPSNYEEFQGDMTASILMGTFDLRREIFYLAWPYSNEIYLVKSLKLEKKIIPKTNLEYTFQPSEIIPWGDNFTVWALPKEASKNIFLLYDKTRDLILKCSKINESGVGETNFERTKHYVLSIYSGGWEPKGEYLFDFESELDLEKWFLASDALFINKPEQKSEDEYEFWKIDLSRFGDN